MKLLRLLISYSMIAFVVHSVALAQSRHALVIGNDSYPGNELTNARNDARSIFAALNGLGYTATLVLDANRVNLSDSIDAFVDTLKPGDTALIYYAGHGFQLDGENYVVPVDFTIVTPEVAKVEGYAFSLSEILDRISSHGATTQIVILDACRDNPFLATRSMRGGWASLGTSAGTFLAFGTSPGSTASDDPRGGHGLFTKDLLKYASTDNEDIEEMFRKVREDVIRDSGGKQVPWIASSLIGSYELKQSIDVTNRLLPNIDDRHDEISKVFSRSIDSSQTNGNGIKFDGENQDVQLSRAIDLARGGKLNAAISILQHIVSLNPACSLAIDLLGLLFHSTGRDLEAIDSFDRAIKVDSRDTSAYAYKCAVEQLMGAPSALQGCEASARLAPSSGTYLTLAIAEHARGQDDDAYTNATKSLVIAPSDAALGRP
jgi:tetratricopeptide (TPR) repeat protein